MAKVNYGTIVNDARGKVNGTVFSKNKSGAYTRKKVTPANPHTSAQTFVRNSFAVLSKNWSGLLTPAQRAAWIAYAQTYPRLDIFGASIQLSGLNMYISLNRILSQVGGALITSPPATNIITPTPFDPNSLVANVAGPSLAFSQTGAAGGANDLFYIFGEAPQPQGRAPQISKMRFVGTLPGVAGPYPATVTPGIAYLAKFGPWLVGQRISLLVATVDNTTGLLDVGTLMSAIST